ncbi:hypothetical protein [Sinosporangium siamense]|uniref:Uncharacterized protein n=1 Tax=Sinosporangium siamense TaxID=1367973 RepID=A0A919RHF1_9ACTN|nr:hypothetical protein [Sinosporangium siamense]GII93936.1 hypothetical protein Ssi02_41670 [Sinosporangium siamense]
MAEPFWIERSRDAVSRYAADVHRCEEEFAASFGDISPVEFACAAWRVATPPLSDPGHVRRHRRVLAAECVRNSWDGSPLAHVTLAAPLPAELTVSRQWWRDRGWRDWPEIFGQFVEPARQDLAKVPYLRTVLHMDAPIPLDGLPPAPEVPGPDLAETAHRALVVLARELNALLGPVVEQLDAGVQRG